MCNYCCPHCITSGSSSGYFGLTTEHAKKIIDKIVDAGIIRLDITGGEPFMREDLLEILEHAVKSELEVVVTTNGSYITEEIAKKLAKLNILTQVSIDGPEKINAKLRGERSFLDALKAIKILIENNVRVRINYTVQQKNIDYMEWAIDFAKENKVTNLYFILLCAQGRASRPRDEYCLTDNQEKFIRIKILQLREENSEKVRIKMLDFKQYSKSCLLIDTNGDFISQSWAEEDCKIVGNILEKDLVLMWREVGNFDHALHLLQYLRHPILYK